MSSQATRRFVGLSTVFRKEVIENLRDRRAVFNSLLVGPLLFPLLLIGMAFLINSSLVGSINMIATIIQLRAPGMTFFKMPFFVWSQLVAAFLLLLAFPPLEAAAVFQLSDRLFDTSFFYPPDSSSVSRLSK